MENAKLPPWEPDLVDEMIREAESRREGEKARAKRRALQLAREQAYQRLALEIDLPPRGQPGANQLSLFPTEPTLFDAGDNSSKR